MHSTELNKFKAVMRDAYQAIGQGEPYTDGGLELMFAAMADLTLRQVQEGLIAHMDGLNGKWRPNVHYIREALKGKAALLWVSADEAWARIPKPGPAGTRIRYDGRVVPDYRSAEWPPCIMNQATAEAMALAAPYIELAKPDMNAARMAFRACYERIVERETAAHRPPMHYVGPGGNHEDRQLLLEQAIEAGLIEPPRTGAPQLGHVQPEKFRAVMSTFRPRITNQPPEEE